MMTFDSLHFSEAKLFLKVTEFAAKAVQYLLMFVQSQIMHRRVLLRRFRLVSNCEVVVPLDCEINESFGIGGYKYFTFMRILGICYRSGYGGLPSLKAVSGVESADGGCSPQSLFRPAPSLFLPMSASSHPMTDTH